MIKKTQGTYSAERNNMFLVQWQLGNFCNYKCSYCQPIFRNGSREWIPIDLAKKVVDNILSKLPTRNVVFDFQGGEVTVYRDFPELLKYVFDNGGATLMVSNAARSLAYHHTIAPYLHTIYFSYHAEQVADLDLFLEKIKIFNPKRVVVYIPMNTQCWDKCVDAYNKVTELGYRAVPKVLYTDFGAKGSNIIFVYTPSQKRFIDECNKNLIIPTDPTDGRTTYLPKFERKSPVSKYDARSIQLFDESGNETLTTAQNLIISQTNVYTGYECYAGIEELVINSLGDVFTSGCMQRSVTNIYSNPNFDLPQVPIICKQDRCWCEADLQVTKIRKNDSM